MTSPSKWSMQAGEDGTYPDQSMKVVIMPVSTPDEATMACWRMLRIRSWREIVQLSQTAGR